MIRKTTNIFVFAFSLLLTGFANADLTAVEKYLTENEITYAISDSSVLTYHTDETELNVVATYIIANHPTVQHAFELMEDYVRPKRVKKKK